MPGIGIPPLEANLPPIVKRNYGKWISHEHPRPGVIKHDSETGEACYTVRAGMPPNARLSTQTLRTLCAVAGEKAGLEMSVEIFDEEYEERSSRRRVNRDDA